MSESYSFPPSPTIEIKQAFCIQTIQENANHQKQNIYLNQTNKQNHQVAYS